MALTHGQRIGPYEVIALLDGGGQGDVYRARDSRQTQPQTRDVAIKVLPDDDADPRHRARFAREAEALGALNHPNIATFIGVEEAPHTLALVMELVDGESLAARLSRAGERRRGSSTSGSGSSGGPGLAAEALRIARQIAAGLEAAHERGLVHRDLKPANVMIRPDSTVKLVDFGLAKSFRHDAKSLGPAAATVTITELGSAIGTAAYMSPEQARGSDVDSRTDVWAFGCVLYEMLTGRRAFDGATAPDVIANVLTREPDLDSCPPASIPRSNACSAAVSSRIHPTACATSAMRGSRLTRCWVAWRQRHHGKRKRRRAPRGRAMHGRWPRLLH